MWRSGPPTKRTTGPGSTVPTSSRTATAPSRRRYARSRRLADVLLLGVLGLVLAGLWVRFGAEQRYTAKMTIAPYVDLTTTTTTRAPTSLTSSFTSLLGLGTSNPNNFDIYLETRHSVAVASKLLAMLEVRHNLYRAMWDDQTGQWHEPQGVLFRLRE